MDEHRNFYETGYAKWIVVLCVVGLAAHSMYMFDFSTLKQNFEGLIGERFLRNFGEFPIYYSYWAYVTIPLYLLILFSLLVPSTKIGRLVSALSCATIFMFMTYNIFSFYFSLSLTQKLMSKTMNFSLLNTVDNLKPQLGGGVYIITFIALILYVRIMIKEKEPVKYSSTKERLANQWEEESK